MTRLRISILALSLVGLAACQPTGGPAFVGWQSYQFADGTGGSDTITCSPGGSRKSPSERAQLAHSYVLGEKNKIAALVDRQPGGNIPRNSPLERRIENMAQGMIQTSLHRYNCFPQF